MIVTLNSEKLTRLNSNQLGIENTPRAIKAGENHQPEELSNTRNGFAHDDNEGKDFDDEKQCKTLSEMRYQ